MSGSSRHDSWSSGDFYETYMGRWSRQMADRFLAWLEPSDGADWLEVGCGTGALSEAIVAAHAPATFIGIDQAPDFVAHAERRVRDPRARFMIGNAETLPFSDASFDYTSSALVLNFVPDRAKALREMKRVTKPGGTVAFYVWDYPGGGMGFIDAFWKAAVQIDPAAAELDESRRFPFCTAEGLRALCAEAELDPQIEALEIRTVFNDFDELWTPFTLGTGPAPGYLQSCNAENRAALQRALRTVAGDTGGAINLPGRAWAIKAAV